jgi:carbonic anhydrase/acetyltransferase-like protein (isoleucine patch superfamily)
MSISEFKEKTPNIDSTVFISHSATIIGDVEIKSEGSVWPNAVIRGDSQSIRIGRKVNIQDNVVIHTEFNKGVIIGDNVSIGHSAIIHGCKIGNNVIIGMGSIILDDARIDDWVLIGAGTVVTQGAYIPSKSLALGIPCKVVRPLNENDLKYISSNAEDYVNLSRQYIKQYGKP